MAKHKPAIKSETARFKGSRVKVRTRNDTLRSLVAGADAMSRVARGDHSKNNLFTALARSLTPPKDRAFSATRAIGRASLKALDHATKGIRKRSKNRRIKERNARQIRNRTSTVKPKGTKF